ncbi:E3 ubiquitin ligase TRAF3IP2 [Magallana gigas]|uniref:E3 ubiquitin ligase TRAF3IP2 n=1 Tax=Magallana gigas TaxID=29159 RepID=UPI00333E3881
MESWYPAVHSHESTKREIENRCPCPECYQYHSSSSSVHSSNTTKSNDLFGDTSPISPSDAFLSPSPQSPRSGHGVHPSITRQSTNPLFGQNGNRSSNVNVKGGWSSVKPFSEPSNIGRECNSSNQLTEQNRIRSLSQYNANGFPGRCECTCGIPGSPEEYTDHSSSAQSVSLTCLCPSSIISENTPNTEKPIVYLTFSGKSKRHFREIKQLCDELRDCLNFSAKCDNYDVIRQSGELNILQWRDTNFSKALWILFCISPEYSNTLRCVRKNNCLSDISENEKGILYIHSISTAEFLDNGSRNFRMIPVVFTKSNASVQDIPCFLRSSPFYKYPMEKENLFERLIQYK